MIRWKAVLITMHKILRSSLKICLAILLFIQLVGCSQKPQNTITLGQWIDEIVKRMGIEYTTTSKPYFINITNENPYFKSIQTAIEWEIISDDVAFDETSELTKEWTAATLVNLAQLEESNPTFNDANKSQFANLVQTSINFGLFTVDQRGCFNPKQVMDKGEALQLLDSTIAYYDTKELEDTIDFDLGDKQVEEIEPIEFDEANETVKVIKDKENIQENDIVQFNDANNQVQTYQVEQIVPTESPNQYYEVEEVYLGPIDYFEVIEEGEITYDEPISFDDAIIEFENSDDDLQIEPVKFNSQPKTHQKTFDGFTIKTRASGSNLTISLNKDLGNDYKLIGSLKLYNFKPIIIWKTSKGSIDHAKFSLNFDSVQSLSVKKTGYNQIYTFDLNDVNKENFINKISNGLIKVGSLKETIIPIGTIDVPIANIPTLTIQLQIYLRINANGKAEIKIANDHAMGFEYKNGLMRLINNHDHDVDFTLNGSATLNAGVKAGIKALSMQLIDVGSDAGIKANATSTIHIYDDNYNHTKQTLENINGEIVDELSSQVDGILSCLDLKAYFNLALTFNSGKTLLGKLGLNKRWNILNASNAPLIPGLNRHIENGIVVKSCTRGSRVIHKVESDPLKEYKKITLNKYAYVLDLNDSLQLEIIGLPNEIEKNDLIFESNDPSIATVNHQGIITAKKEGACHIIIKDTNNQYTTTVNLVVRMPV